MLRCEPIGVPGRAVSRKGSAGLCWVWRLREAGKYNILEGIEVCLGIVHVYLTRKQIYRGHTRAVGRSKVALGRDPTHVVRSSNDREVWHGPSVLVHFNIIAGVTRIAITGGE